MAHGGSPYRGSIRLVEPCSEITATCELTIEVSNQSDQPWTSEGPNPIYISYHWLDDDWNMVVFDGVRTSLPDGGIQPGETKTVLFQVTAPRAEGTYHLVITLVREGIEWFDDKPDFKFSISCINIKKKIRIALLGTPRSGNTWMHRILSELFGLTVIAVHRLRDVNWDDLPEKFILQLHSHPEVDIVRRMDELHIKKIVMCRHPHDVLISILHFCKYEPQTARWLDGENGNERNIINASPGDDEFMDYAISERAACLLNLTKEWGVIPETITIKYELFVKDTISQIKHLLNWLGLSVPNDCLKNIIQNNSFQNLQKHNSNNHFWQGNPGNWKKLILKENAATIYKKHQTLFEYFGYLSDADEYLTDAQAEENWNKITDSYKVKSDKIG